MAMMEDDFSQAAQEETPSTRPILVVEENCALRERWYDLLTHHGFVVLTAESLDHMAHCLKHERPCLILVGITLAATNGLDLTHQIRSVDAHVPIILLSHATDRPTKPCMIPGVHAILAAEVSDQILLLEIERWLNTPPQIRSTEWSGTVLVIDDEPKVRNFLQEFLREYGFTIIQAGTGEEALEQFQRHLPAIVLLDIKLPGMDGLLALKKMKTLHPDTAIIVMTGLEEEELMIQAFLLGAYDYVTKPLNLTALATMLLHVNKLFSQHVL